MVAAWAFRSYRRWRRGPRKRATADERLPGIVNRVLGRFTKGARTSMTTRRLMIAAIVLIVGGSLAAFVSVDLAGPAVGAFILGVIAIILAILRRPREAKARLVASLASFGTDWGDQIGPGPGQTGPTIPVDAAGPRIMRAYAGKNDFEIRTRRIADAAALAQRGFFPTSETFVAARWRTIDWLVGILLLLVAFIIGLFALVYMSNNKPGGVATVVY
jgi:hypothetical protein